jgi:hypothetical protein
LAEKPTVVAELPLGRSRKCETPKDDEPSGTKKWFIQNRPCESILHEKNRAKRIFLILQTKSIVAVFHLDSIGANLEMAETRATIVKKLIL